MEDYILFGLVLLLLSEQVLCWITGSFLYRHGFPIKTVLIPNITISDWAALKQKQRKLSIKIDNGRNEVYLRSKYPFGTIGPQLFMGQIVYNKTGIMKIRVGYIAAIFLLYILIYPLLSGGIYQVLNSLALLAVIGWLYLRFQNSYKGVMN